MGRRKTPGLTKRNEVWHIDKQIRGTRVCESTGESSLKEAEAYLARRTETIRQASIYGTRPQRSFRQAATKYLNETKKRSLERDARCLATADPYIGSLPIHQVHMGTLQNFIRARQRRGVKSATINRELGVIRHILNLAARLWRDEHGLTWLETAPLIQLLKVHDARAPYPLSEYEQSLLFRELPPHLQRMALFKINTGIREQEVCRLIWDWEVRIPELNTSVFIIPNEFVKNEEERLVVLNQTAESVLAHQRNQDEEYVFTYKGRRLVKMNNSAWKRARERAAQRFEKETGKPCPSGFRSIRVHDLKHTFGRRLRAAGVSFEDRQDLLGHKSGRITTHYSAAELESLKAAANRVCRTKSRKSPALIMLKQSVN